MTPPHIYWIKFMNNPNPEKFNFKHFDEMWHWLRDAMLREPQRYGIIEWMIRD